MLQRVNLVTQMDPFVGKYFSTEYVRRQVLMQTEKEYKEIGKQIKKDIESGMALDPVDVNSMNMMSQQNDAMQPELDAAAAEADFEYQKKLAAEKPKTSSSNK
jgi:hypothetical protein